MPMDTHVGWRGGESFCCSPCYTFPYMLIHWNSFRKICIFRLLLWSFRHWLNFYIISSASAVKMQSEAINYDVRNQEHTSSLPLVSCQFPPNFLAWHSTFFFMLSNNPVNWFFTPNFQSWKILEKLGKIPKFSSHFRVRANLYSRKTFWASPRSKFGVTGPC